ncbi:MAG: hypothetical protein IH950_13730 [Bacteroidetes bacterium]|nr:hypothetical protein [Bacteroidota bacterium]
MENEKEIIDELQTLFGNEVLDVTPFPKPYYKDISNVNAIYLGCDPSNQHSHNLPYAFALESNMKIFNNFLNTHSSNLFQVDLNWKSVYVQNLCQNYFRKETFKNLPIWKPATKLWIPRLKKELQIFNIDIPVFLTSSYIYDLLVSSKWKKYKPKQFYTCEIEIPIPETENLLERPLIPFFRNRRKVDYHLSNPMWQNYKNRIREILN